jgi:hypothetical protein
MSKEVDIRGDRATEFPLLEEPLSITHARVLACRYQRWDAIGSLTNLVSLEVIDWHGSDLEALRPLAKLEQLSITHLPRVTSLDPLSDLTALRRLILGLMASQYYNGKFHEVESLAPLSGLPLEEVTLLGVRPASKAVDDLLAIPTLTKALVVRFAAKERNRLREVVDEEPVAWQTPAWGSSAESEREGPLSTGITYRTPK